MEQTMQIVDQLRFAWGLLLAEWIFFDRAVPQKRAFPLRALLVVVGCSALSLMQLPLRDVVFGSPLSTPAMFLILGVAAFLPNLVTMAGAKYCFQVTWTRLLSRCLLGACLERVVTVFLRSWIVTIWFPALDAEHPVVYLALLLACYAVVYGIGAGVLAPRYRKDILPPGKEDPVLCFLYLASAVILAAVSGYASTIAEWSLHSVWQYQDLGEDGLAILYFVSSMQAVIAGIIFAFQYILYRVTSLRQKTGQLHHLLAEKSRQYAVSRGNIALINRRCHELKLRLAEAEQKCGPLSGELVQSTRQAVRVYDAAVHTGNAALDTFLTEKNLFCVRENIRLSCTVSARNLEQVDHVDLYALLDTSMELALDSVMRCGEAEKRVISLSLSQHQNQLLIGIEYYTQAVRTAGEREALDAAGRELEWIAGRYNGGIQFSSEGGMERIYAVLLAE